MKLGHKIAIRSGLLLFSVVLSVLSAEIVLAVLKPAPVFHQINLFQPDSREECYELSFNSKLIYVPKPNINVQNGYGHRGREFPFKKGPAGRMVVMGDSVVEALRWIDPEDRFTEIMDTALGDECEVINLGVPGYSFVQEVEYLKTLGLRFKPNYVIWGLCYNDFQLCSVEAEAISAKLDKVQKNSFYRDFYKNKNRLEKILYRSNLYRYMKYMFSDTENTNLGKTFNDALFLNADEIDSIVKELKALSRRHDFRQAFIFMPIAEDDGYAETIQTVESLLEKNGMPYLNLNTYFDAKIGKARKTELLPDNWHLSEEGHRIVAEEIRDYFTRTGFIKSRMETGSEKIF